MKPSKLHFLITLLIVLFINGKFFAQTVPYPKIQAPNTASLGKYGDIPVSYFTGVPNISFPLYNISVGNIKSDISLNYHPGSVKPNEHPGWVGLGWNLNVYGKITRTAKNWLDEGNNSSPTVYPYYPDPTYHPGGNGATFMNTSDWETSGRMATVFSTQQTTPQSWYDVQADEFSFNFGSYAGTFYYTATGWQVVSQNANLKVQELGFMDYNEISSNLANYTPAMGGLSAAQQSRMFRGFIITTDNGTKYTFGCSTTSGFDPNCGVEFVAKYAVTSSGVEANGWLLRKIEDINGNVVTFDYQKKYPVCSMSFYTSQTSYACYDDWSSSSAWAAGPVNTNLHAGRLIYPVYLSKITTPNESLEFSIAETTELKYSDIFLRYAAYDQGGPAGLVEFPLNALYSDVNNLRWYQLNLITVKNASNDVVRKFKFNLSNVSTQRLALNSFSEQDRAGNDIKKYQFAYDNIIGLPEYGGDQTDHWGFYNGTLLNGQLFSNLPALRATNPTLITRGLLSSVTYPTGGKTEYVWEANKAASVVSVNRQSITSFSPLYVGGCRIKEIRNYADPLAAALTTKYFYVKNFVAGTDPATLTSSGILNGTPKYYFNIPPRTGIYGSTTVAYQLESVNSLVSYSYNGSASHVGYSEVVEQKPDNSYTKYNFTNFDIDLNNQAHYDIIPGVIGWVIGSSEDSYVTMSSLELERGKPLMITAFNSANNTVEKTRFYYRTDAARLNDFIKMYDLRNSLTCLAYDAVVLASAHKVFKYNYYVVKEEKTTYDFTGGNAVTKTKDYEYNASNQISKLTETTNGRKLITKFKYPSDFTITTATTPEVLALQSMKTKNIVAAPVEEQNLQEISAVQTLIGGKLNKYKDFGSGLIKPSEQLGIDLTSPSSDLTVATVNASNQLVYHPAFKSKILFDSYETNGNPTQIHRTGDINISRLWDYKKNLPVAEAVNASQGEFAACSFEAEGKGSWTFTGIPIQDITAPTGRKVYSFTSTTPITKTGLVSTKEYVLSYWRPSSSTALTVAGTIAGSSVTGRTVNGWKYFEQKITGQTSVTLSVTSGLIDEVRLYPSNAQLTTYTYDPLVGVTSICDHNSKINYYEYDGFGRLVIIRDLDRNIVKKYCYNYDKQTENCNIYYNDLQTGTYNKSGCGSCSNGSAVTYTVPAGKYLSTNSLTEANSFALNEISANGQAYADQNGVCNATPPAAINSSNGIGYTVTISFYNLSTFITYDYIATTGNKTQNAVVPCGNYRVTMTPGVAGTYTYYISGGGSLRTSSNAVFNSVSGGGTLSIGITN